MDQMMQALMSVIGAAGGVARVSDLTRRGFSRYRVAGAIERGNIVRVRRDWVALPTADAELVAAARAGVVLSCITLARRLGLWVLAEDRCHVAAEPHARAETSRAHVHWARALVPRPPGALVDRVENALALVASCQVFEAAVAVWDSALQKGLVVRGDLARLALPPAAREVLAATDPFADSGLESIFRIRLRWLGIRILSQVWLAGRRVDFLLGERLVVQIDGGHHVGAQRDADIGHDAQLKLLGYHVLRFSYGQVIDDWPGVQDVIMRAVAQGLHRAP